MNTKTQDTTDGTDQRILKAIGHPLRQRILRSLNEGVASPSDLARAMGEPLPNVSYHVKILLECDAIELVKTTPVRGALEHFYRATVRPHIDAEAWATLPKSTKDTLFGQTIDAIGTHISAAAAEEGLDDPLTHISWTTLELDQKAYEELGEHLDKTLEKAMDLQAETAARRADIPEDEREEHRTEMVLMHFHRAASK